MSDSLRLKPPEAPTEPEKHFFGLTERQLAFLLLALAPAFFCSNMLVARATHDLIPPVALAFWRWAVTFLLLSPITLAVLWRHRDALRRDWLDLLVLGALGMGVCGAFVYIGADSTTATNIGLIYAASPILIVVFARLFYGESLSMRQGLGVAICLLGVLAIICKGDPRILLELLFVVGDLWITAAAIAWAVYSLLLRHRNSELPMIARFAAITAGGLIILLPFYIGEMAAGDLVTWNGTTIVTILFLALVPSCGAYLSYAKIQRTLGAGPTSLLMYLVPLYNGVLAFLLLGETLEIYHLVGAAMVLPGIYLATRKA
ncbi:DMT family transporter [Denitrobaculum tricleocarpae]|uniref:DMT family transporter n=1 Tax=Denitrobaculum tricleocarpae TaxID=2591009 RepID=UPI0015D383E7|nr:DMT family transporter [Denitrobaculum tricleocarpae]